MPPLLALLLALPLFLALACAPPRIASAGAAPVSYVALGASDAVGVGARDPQTEGWVPRLHSTLPPGSSLTNLGVSGSLLAQAIEQQLPVALEARPQLVSVWLCVNDLNARVPLDRYQADLDQLLGALETTGALVLVGNVPDVSALPAYRQADPELIGGEVARWNAAIEATTTRHGAVLVDLQSSRYELSAHPEYVASDGFHPSSDGYARLSELFSQALEARGGLAAIRGG